MAGEVNKQSEAVSEEKQVCRHRWETHTYSVPTAAGMHIEQHKKCVKCGELRGDERLPKSSHLASLEAQLAALQAKLANVLSWQKVKEHRFERVDGKCGCPICLADFDAFLDWAEDDSIQLCLANEKLASVTAEYSGYQRETGVIFGEHRTEVAELQTKNTRLWDALKDIEFCDVGGIYRVCPKCRQRPHRFDCTLGAALTVRRKEG